jgi:LSD1 subclass zinc finger protein
VSLQLPRRRASVGALSMLIVKANCPHCGAPLSLVAGQQHVICAYCDVSSLVQTGQVAPGSPAAAPRLTAESVSPEDVRRIKQLIFEGKRPEAVALYAKAARVAPADAEVAVTQLFVPELLGLYRYMPINAVGCSIAVLLIAGSTGAAVLGVMNRDAGGGYLVLAIAGALLALLLVRWLLPKVKSGFVCAFGARGQARVVKRVVVHTFKEGHLAALLLFEVHPAAGGAPFYDEEAMLVRAESLHKLTPGNVVRVRYDEPGRKRVFPDSPIEVVG